MFAKPAGRSIRGIGEQDFNLEIVAIKFYNSAMPIYVWTAKDKSGASVFREVEAATVQESRDALLAAGYTDLALHEEDVIAETNRSFGTKAMFLGEEIKVTARDRVQYRSQPPLSISGIVLGGLKREKSFFIVASLALALSIYRQSVVGVIIFAVLLIGWPLFKIGIGLPAILYRKLADASDWERWDEVLRLVKQLRVIGRYHFIKVPEAELTRLEAKALAGKGQLSEAVALYSRVENQPGAPTWLFKSHLSGIYHSGGDYAAALKLLQEAITLKPDVTLYLELSRRLARYHADASGARAALEQVNMDLVVDILKPSVGRLRGIIAWLEKDFENARAELESAIFEMEKTRHLPFRTGQIAVAKGYLCCAYARLGAQEAAQKCYDEACEYLVATKETRLLQNCQEALGVLSGGSS